MSARMQEVIMQDWIRLLWSSTLQGINVLENNILHFSFFILSFSSNKKKVAPS